MDDALMFYQGSDLQKIADEQARRVQRYIDEATLKQVESRLAEFGYVKVDSKSRWFELFGTPEKAARTLYYDKTPICAGCALLDECEKIPDEELDTCLLSDYDTLLKWLKEES